MNQETTEVLKVLAPYLTLALAAVGGLLGYGAIKAKVEAWDRVRTEDLDRHKAEHDELRRDLQQIQEAIQRNAEQTKRDLDGIGGKLNVMNREIGVVQADALRAVEAERHRIDVHGNRSQQQHAQTAEFFANETRAALAKVEGLVARLEKQAGPEPVPGGKGA